MREGEGGLSVICVTKSGQRHPEVARKRTSCGASRLPVGAWLGVGNKMFGKGKFGQ